MRLDTGLFQQQTQKQILSPQMIQSMEILVLNQQQLDERISEELESNVALEREEGKDAGEERSEGSGDTDSGSAVDTKDKDIDLFSDREDRPEPEELRDLGERYEQLHELQQADFWAESAPRKKSSVAGGEEEFEWVNQVEGRAESLADHLLSQLRMKPILTERQKAMCEEIIFNLDERGWQLHSLDSIGSSLAKGALLPESDPRLSETPPATSELEDSLRIVQGLDPAGVAAENLVDCLCLQLHRDPGENQFEELLVRHHLEDMAKNRLPHIAKSTGRTIEEIKDALEVIRSLEPNPGRFFIQVANPRIVPDIIIERDVDGVFHAEMDGQSTPRLRISPHYRELLQGAKKDPELKKYLKKHIENAEWLMGAVQQRNSTLHRVAEEILKRQQPFFSEGDRFLAPMRMQEVADAIGINVSTVSRAISGKWFQAPGMIRELRSLFSGGTVRDDGAEESRGGVIARIQEMIEKEDSKKPLSDAQIVKELEKAGVRISRRTVTKYREAEDIPSSRERRQY